MQALLGSNRVSLYNFIFLSPSKIFVQLRYSLDIDLPDFVIEHPIIEALGQGANDLVTWSNVGFTLEFVNENFS